MSESSDKGVSLEDFVAKTLKKKLGARVPVKGYEGKYCIDRGGNVYSLPRGRGTRKTIVRLNPGHDGGGYSQVVLHLNGEPSHWFVHRLMATTFLEQPSALHVEVNHKDGRKDNNRLENLEWVTRSQNVKHAYENGLWKPACGEKHKFAKLNEEIVRDIRMRMNEGESSRRIAASYGIAHSTVQRIFQRKAWRHVV